MKTVVQLTDKTEFDWVKLGLLALSMALQILRLNVIGELLTGTLLFSMGLMITIHSSGRADTAEKKRRQNGPNNASMVLCFLVTVINVIITSWAD